DAFDLTRMCGLNTVQHRNSPKLGRGQRVRAHELPAPRVDHPRTMRPILGRKTMLRKARPSAPLGRSLHLGAAIVPALVVTGSVLVGCEDENAAETHVKKLKDPTEQRLAIKHLLQMYGDAESKDKKSDDKPNVKALLETIMQPLV